MEIKCNKTLTFGDGSTSFIRGNKYEVVNWRGKVHSALKIDEITSVIDEQGEEHILGIWAKHFSSTK